MKKTVKKSTGSKGKSPVPCNYTILAARIFLAGIFAMSLFGKVTGFSGQAGYIAGSGYPFAEVLLVGAILLELVGVLSLVLGYKMHYGAIALIVFTVAATLMFHVGAGQEIAFLKNLAVIGGLLSLMMQSPGKFSIDGK